MKTAHHGIALIGSSIVDGLVPAIGLGQLTYVDANKFVPESELKGERIQYSVGGMALNVAVNLAKIGGGYPLAVIGKVGDDHRAELIRQTLQEQHINAAQLIVDGENETSWTEVIHLRMPDGKIERIFRHALGAMGSFCEEDIPFAEIAQFKIAMFGYGLLLPQMDLENDEYGTVMGWALARAQTSGVMTALDFVSPNEENLFKFLRYRRTLRYVDICCINEDQACSITNRKNPREACTSLVEDLKAKLAVVHCGAEGPNYAYTHELGLQTQENFVVSPEDYKGNAGAGDAFSAGFLHGVHQDWPLQKSLRFAAAAAAISLGDVSCTGAMRCERDILDYMERVLAQKEKND